MPSNGVDNASLLNSIGNYYVDKRLFANKLTAVKQSLGCLHRGVHLGHCYKWPTNHHLKINGVVWIVKTNTQRARLAQNNKRSLLY
jgi:hypothetical protein